MNTKLNNWFLLPPENNISKVGIFSEFYNMNTYFGFNYLLKDDYRDNIYTSGYCGCEYYIDPYNHRRNPYTDKPSLGPLQDNKIGSGTVLHLDTLMKRPNYLNIELIFNILHSIQMKVCSMIGEVKVLYSMIGE